MDLPEALEYLPPTAEERARRQDPSPCKVVKERPIFGQKTAQDLGPFRLQIASWKYARFVAHGVGEKISDPCLCEPVESAVSTTKGRVKVCCYEGIKECDPRGDTDGFRERGEWV